MELPDLPNWSTLSSYAARTAYTAVLAVAAFLLVREAVRLWIAEPLTLGELTFVDAGTIKPEKGSGLVRDIIDRRNALRDVILRLVNDQEQTADSAAQLSAANPLNPAFEVFLPHRAFSDVELNDLRDAADSAPRIELKIQGNDIGSFLTSLQRWISPVNALKVSVFKRGDQFSFLLDWPRDDLTFAAAFADSAFRADVFDEAKLGATIGCRILWLELAESASKISETHPDVFCRWADARMLYEAATGAESGGWPQSFSSERYEKAVAILGNLPVTEAHFPPLQNLYALLLGAMGRTRPEVDHAWSNLRRVTSGEPPLLYEPPAEATPSGTDTDTGAGHIVAFFAKGGGQSRVTVAAVAQDSAEKMFLVVPDYAFDFAEGPADEAEAFMADGLGGPVGERVGIFEAKHGEFGIALIALDDDVTAGNTILGQTIERVGQAGADEEITFVSAARGAQTTRIRSVITDDRPERLVTDRKVSQPGDGGAPVLNADNVLIAMGYIGRHDVSELVALQPAFAELGLTLAERHLPEPDSTTSSDRQTPASDNGG